MRVVVQRVSRAEVSVDGKTAGKIGPGLLVFFGVAEGDGEDAAAWMANKIANLRIFPDDDDKMNLSAMDRKYAVLCISQFTLLADCRRGNRPNFMNAAQPEKAEKLYEFFCSELSKHLEVQKGVFGAMMRIDAVNDGPVTVVIDR